MISRRDDTRGTERRLAIAQEQVAQLTTAYSDQETGRRGFVLTGDERFLEPFNSGSDRAESLMRSLRAIADDEPALRPLLDRVVSVGDTWRTRSALRAHAAQRSGDAASAAGQVAGKGKELFDSVAARVHHAHATCRPALRGGGRSSVHGEIAPDAPVRARRRLRGGGHAARVVADPAFRVTRPSTTSRSRCDGHAPATRNTRSAPSDHPRSRGWRATSTRSARGSTSNEPMRSGHARRSNRARPCSSHCERTWSPRSVRCPGLDARCTAPRRRGCGSRRLLRHRVPGRRSGRRRGRRHRGPRGGRRHLGAPVQGAVARRSRQIFRPVKRTRLPRISWASSATKCSSRRSPV